MLAAIKHIADDNFVFSNIMSDLVHWARKWNTVKLLQCKTLNLSSSEMWLSVAQSGNPLTTAFNEPYSSVSMSREWTNLDKSTSDWVKSGKAVRSKHSIWVKKKFLHVNSEFMFCQVVQRVQRWTLRSVGRGFKSYSRQRRVTTLGKANCWFTAKWPLFS